MHLEVTICQMTVTQIIFLARVFMHSSKVISKLFDCIMNNRQSSILLLYNPSSGQGQSDLTS